MYDEAVWSRDSFALCSVKRFGEPRLPQAVAVSEDKGEGYCSAMRPDFSSVYSGLDRIVVSNHAGR